MQNGRNNFQPDAYGETSLEPTLCALGFSSDGSGDIALGTQKTGFVDEVGSSSSSGYTQNDGDSNIAGGRLGPREFRILHGLQVWVTYATHATQPAAAEIAALLNSIVLTLEVDGTPYRLGKAVSYIGPVATNGAMPAIRAFRAAKEIPAGAAVKFVAKVNRSVADGLGVSKDYVLWCEFPSTRGMADTAAVKS